MEPATTPKTTAARPMRRYSSRVGDEETKPRRAQGFQNHGVVDAKALTGGERAAEHQRRGEQRHRARAAQPQHQIADEMIDRVERVLDAHGGDGGKRVGQRLDERRFFRVVPPSANVSVAISVCGAPANAPGENTRTKLMPRLCQSTARRLAMRARYVAAEHIDRDRIAGLELEVIGGPAFQRDQRRTGIVGRPPFAGDETGAGRKRRRVSDAAVAAQHPCRSLAGLEIFGI